MDDSHLLKPENTLPPLVEMLEGARHGTSFDGLIYSEVTSVLLTVFPFRAGLTDLERRGVLNRAIGHAAEAGGLTVKRLTDAIRKEEQKQLALPLTSYILATHLSFTRHGHPSPRTFRDGISLAFSLPQRFAQARAHEDLGLAEDDTVVRSYTAVLVKVAARSTSDAFQKSIGRLDLLRALWNFAHLRRQITGFHSDPTTPLARIRTGRVHTLHLASGALATDQYFFNPEHRLEATTYLSDTDWNRMQQYLRSARQRLPRLRYAADVERAFVHYGHALDSTDMSMAYLRLWSVLELLSGLGGERYDSLIRRSAAVFKPDALTRTVLEHLRFQRNALVHLGTPQEDMRPLVFQLKMFVERFLGLHVTLGRHFASPAEFGSFLDLPSSQAALELKRNRIDLALRFRGFTGNGRRGRRTSASKRAG